MTTANSHAFPFFGSISRRATRGLKRLLQLARLAVALRQQRREARIGRELLRCFRRQFLNLGRVAVALRRADLTVVEIERRRRRVELDQLFTRRDRILELTGLELQQPLLRIIGGSDGFSLSSVSRICSALSGAPDFASSLTMRLRDRLVGRIEAPDSEVDLDRLVLVALRLVRVGEVHERELAGRIDRENRVRRRDDRVGRRLQARLRLQQADARQHRVADTRRYRGAHPSRPGRTSARAGR